MNRLKKWLCSLTKSVAPGGIPQEYLDALDMYAGPVTGLLKQSAVMLAGGYRVQVVKAFNRWACIAEIVLVWFCFGFAGLDWPALIAAGVVLSVLAARDAFTHHDVVEDPKPRYQYYLASAVDATVTGIFVLASQSLAWKTASELAIPYPRFYHGALICLPMTAILRMVLRPMPDPKLPFEDSGMPAEKFFKRAWWLNFLWMATYWGGVMQAVGRVHSHIADFLLGTLPWVSLGLWKRLQRDGLGRTGILRSIFHTAKEIVLKQKRQHAMAGMGREDTLYSSYVAVQGLIFGELVLAMIATMYRWLSGQGADGFAVTGSIIGFAAASLTWRYVKRSNQMAAKALDQEIAAEQAKAKAAAGSESCPALKPSFQTIA